MRYYFLILFFVFSCTYGQISESDTFITTITDNTALVSSWPQKMMRSYTRINNHTPLTLQQKMNIYSRLSSSYVRSTFGPAGSNEDSCDFFIYFENDAVTPLVSRTITKTGATLRWDFGNATYIQNDLPSGIPDEFITVTSTDYFDGITAFNLQTDTFSGPLFNLEFYLPNASDINLGNNLFDGQLSDLPNATQGTFIFGFNAFTGSLPDISDLGNLYKLHLYNTYRTGGLGNGHAGITGAVEDLPTGTTMRELQVFNNQLSELNCTEFPNTMTRFYVHNNEIPYIEIDSCLEAMVDFYDTHHPNYDCEINISGLLNGFVPDTATYQPFQDLDSIWTSRGKALTFTHDVHPGKLAAGGALVVTFDEGLLNTYNTARPLFDKYSAKGTVYICPYWVWNGFSAHAEPECSWDQLIEMSNDGWEIESHSWDHYHNYGTMTAGEIHDELIKIDTAHTNNGLPSPEHFAYPGGAYDDESGDSVSNYFLTARIVDYYYTGENTNKMEIPGYWFENIRNDSVFFKKMLDRALFDSVAIVTNNHAIAPPGQLLPCTAYDGGCCSYEVMEAVLRYAQSIGVRILTIDELYNEM